jgi:dynein regulatory complex protein 1
MEQFKELQSKFSKFQALDNTKFQELRKMNEEDAQELVRKIISADKIIWGKILQSTTEWKCPESLNNVLNKFLNSMNSGTISSQNDSKSSILSYSNEIQSSKSLKRLSLSFDEYMTLFSSPETKNFLQLLTEETSGFLVEKKLLDLLAPLEKEEQFLMKLDCIFKALGINSISQIESLENMFFVSESAEESEKFTSQTSSAEKKRSLISPQKVIPTLQIFIESLKKNHSTPDDKPILVNVSSEVESDEKYWRSVADVLNGKYFRIWDAVHNGLLLYHDLLLKRMKNAEDIKMLERENMELRALLHMNSKSDVMKELQIPPTEFNIKKE